MIKNKEFSHGQPGSRHFQETHSIEPFGASNFENCVVETVITVKLFLSTEYASFFCVCVFPVLIYYLLFPKQRLNKHGGNGNAFV